MRGISGCITEEETNVVTSDSELGSDTALYKCAYPMCGGRSIKFDSRTLALTSCTFDARRNVLDCEADVATSPTIPSAFWSASAMQLTCSEGLRFQCAGTIDVQSCVCTPTTADIKYGPVISIKPKG